MDNVYLPSWGNNHLEVGMFYTTIVVDNTYFPTGEEFKVVNDNGQVRASAVVTNVKETDFDHLGFDDLKNSANHHLRSWANSAEFFSNRFKEQFAYNVPVQLITFEVKSIMSFDSPLIESTQDEKELGLPNDEQLGIENSETNVNYVIEE